MADENNPNDFRPRRTPGQGQPPKVFSFVKPELETHIDQRELEQKEPMVLVCRCDKVCTCDTVPSAACRCDTVSKCTCEAVKVCSCDTVIVCQCDTVKRCRCNPQCSCDSYSSGGGGTRVCRCVPVRAH